MHKKVRKMYTLCVGKNGSVKVSAFSVNDEQGSRKGSDDCGENNNKNKKLKI